MAADYHNGCRVLRELQTAGRLQTAEMAADGKRRQTAEMAADGREAADSRDGCRWPSEAAYDPVARAA